MVYSFYDPDIGARGLGNYMILDQLEKCESQGLPYLYLGYWIDESPKMSYKKEFHPSEILTSRGWRPLGEDTDPPR